jgi:hypothetical protein
MATAKHRGSLVHMAKRIVKRRKITRKKKQRGGFSWGFDNAAHQAKLGAAIEKAARTIKKAYEERVKRKSLNPT